MSKILILLLLVVGVPLFPQSAGPAPAKTEAPSEKADEGVNFLKGEWKELLEKAKKEKKSVFLDAYATWCGPCKWMDEYVFSKKETGDFLKANFLSYRMDMDQEAFAEYKEKFDIKSYPTYLFFDSEGNLVHKVIGAYELKEFLEEAGNALNPEKSYYPLLKKYESGDKTEVAMRELISRQYRATGGVKPELVEDYFEVAKEPSSQSNWRIIESFVTDPKSKTFKMIVKNQETFSKALGEETVLRKIYTAKMGYYANKNDWKNYAAVSENYINKVAKDDWKDLDGIAWKFYQSIDDKELLKKADGYIARSIKLFPNFLNYETQAHLHFKQGKYKEAHESALLSFQYARAKGENYENSMLLLSKIISKLLEPQNPEPAKKAAKEKKSK